MKLKLSTALLTCALMSASAMASVTAEQAAAEPNNIELNRQFAQEQFAAGELKDALTGIERVIIASPLDLSARFFRINVMVLLNRGAEVRDELETILTLSLPSADLQRARDLLTAIDRKNAKLNARVTARLGVEYLDNANGWTDFKELADGTHEARVADSVNQFNAGNNAKQLDDIATTATFSTSGSYALADDKATNLKFAVSASSKQLQDTLNQEAKTYSVRLGLSHAIGGSTMELGGNIADIDKVNYTNGGDTAVNTDVDVTGYYFNYNRKLSGGASVNYRYSASAVENTGFNNAVDARQFDVDSTSHSLSLLRGLSRQTLGRLSYTYASTRNQDQALVVSGENAKAKTDGDTHTVEAGLFHNRANGDSASARLKYADSRAKYKLQTFNEKRQTQTTTLTVDYRVPMQRFVEGADGWTAGGGVSLSTADSNLANYERDSNTANLFVERRWDVNK